MSLLPPPIAVVAVFFFFFFAVLRSFLLPALDIRYGGIKQVEEPV